MLASDMISLTMLDGLGWRPSLPVDVVVCQLISRRLGWAAAAGAGGTTGFAITGFQPLVCGAEWRARIGVALLGQNEARPPCDGQVDRDVETVEPVNDAESRWLYTRW